MGTPNTEPRTGTRTWVLRAPRSRAPHQTTTEQGVTAGRTPGHIAPDPESLDPELPERDVLEQRHAAVPQPVDEFPTEIPPDEPEADVLEQSREISVEDEPEVVDEPPRDR
jgi:hypothetical protein